MAGQAEEIAFLKAQVAEISAVLALPQVKDCLKTLAKGKEKGQEQRKEHDVNAHAITEKREPSKKPWDEDIPELSSPSYSPPASFSYSFDSSSSSNPRRRKYSTHELKNGVSRLSEAMRNTKFALQQLEDLQRSAEDDDFAKDSFKWKKKLQYRGGPLFNKYRQRDTCAYVAARMPAVYSAVHRVLSEIRRRLPEFKPQKILDYGSGPGTAIWSAKRPSPK
ncbi:hypothetical protein L7F22_041216 [Adiantum nelumboides]|nr:hypothetical protein [Adiantum nelumboides]